MGSFHRLGPMQRGAGELRQGRKAATVTRNYVCRRVPSLFSILESDGGKLPSDSAALAPAEVR